MAPVEYVAVLLNPQGKEGDYLTAKERRERKKGMIRRWAGSSVIWAYTKDWSAADSFSSFSFDSSGSMTTSVGTISEPIVRGSSSPYRYVQVRYTFSSDSAKTLTGTEMSQSYGELDSIGQDFFESMIGGTLDSTNYGSISVEAVPEPATAGLLGISALALYGIRRIYGRV